LSKTRKDDPKSFQNGYPVGECGKEVANFGKLWEIVGNSFFI
jgi:hypothetical protein